MQGWRENGQKKGKELSKWGLVVQGGTRVRSCLNAAAKGRFLAS